MRYPVTRLGILIAGVAIVIALALAITNGNVPRASSAPSATAGSGPPSPSGLVGSSVVPSTGSPIAPSPTSAGTSRPDIVFLLIDDLAQMDNRIWERLPTIRHLFLDTGVDFTDYIGNDPLCCPGRANLLTGQWSHHHGVVYNDARLFDPRESIATELQSTGYWTGIFGKYFNKTDLLADKSPLGWDRSFIFGRSYWNMNTYVDGKTVRASLATRDYSTTLVGNQAVAALRQISDQTRPRFVWLSPYAVHAGRDQAGRDLGPAPAPQDVGDPRCVDVPAWSTAANTETDMSDKPAYLRPRKIIATWPLVRTCETLLSVDRLLARVMAEFATEGRPEPMVILSVDNGMDFGAHHWTTKFVPYSTPIPLFVHWPAHIGATPGIITTTVTNVDFAPTMCAIAGCVMGPFPNGHGVDGISFLPALLARGGPLGRDVVFEEHPSAVDGSNMPPWNGVRTTAESTLGHWVYTVYQTGEKELYDISGGPCWTWHVGMPGDPCELTSLAGLPAYAAVQTRLAALLADRENHPLTTGPSPGATP